MVNKNQGHGFEYSDLEQRVSVTYATLLTYSNIGRFIAMALMEGRIKKLVERL